MILKFSIPFYHLLKFYKMEKFQLIDAQSLEIVLEDLTRDEALDIQDKYPNEYFLRNAEFDSVLA